MKIKYITYKIFISLRKSNKCMPAQLGSNPPGIVQGFEHVGITSVLMTYFMRLKQADPPSIENQTESN